jgi:SH3 domain protein
VKAVAASAAMLPAFAAAMLLALPAARAATAYVSDELVLGVYADQNGQGQRLATLHSGASVETLAVNGEFTQVRLGDGILGWVKSAYLTTQEPATARAKQLQEELDRSRATTPALAEAAARSELEQLKSALKDKQTELDALRAEQAPVAAHRWVGVVAVLAALTCGFWLGYAALARRVRHKFGGIKVY